MKKIVFTILLIWLSIKANGQHFSKEFGDVNDTINIRNVIVTADSNIAVFADCSRNPFNEIVFLKLDTLGDTLMTRRYSGAKDVSLKSVQQSGTDSSFYILADQDSGSSIVNIDKNGNIRWQKNYFLQDTIMHFTKLKLVDNDSLFALGNFNHKSFIVKMNLNGDVSHEIIFDRDPNASVNDYPTIENIMVDRFHNIICTGQERCHASGCATYSALLVKLNSNGDSLWTFSNYLAYEKFTDIVEVTTGEYWIVSEYWHQGVTAVKVNMVDTTGNYISSFGFYDPTIIHSSFYSLPNGNVVLAGYSNQTSNSIFRVELDLSANVVEYKNGRAFIASEAFLNENKYIFGSMNDIVMYDPHFDNCFLEDSIATSSISPWIWPDQTELGMTPGSNLILSTNTNWNLSSGITMNIGCISLGSSELTMESFNLFPNPARGDVKFHFNGVTKGSVFRLYNTNSKLLIEIASPGSNMNLFNADRLPSGIYFYNFISESGMNYKGKIAVTH